MTNYSEINDTGLNNSTQIPEYDYEIVHSPPTEELVPVSIAYGTTLVLGVAGNGLVIFSVSRYHQMMTITNTFLLSLASADLLLLLVCVPVKVSHTRLPNLSKLQRFQTLNLLQQRFFYSYSSLCAHCKVNKNDIWLRKLQI